jgi:DNA-binding XRE family transcriptional regulator
MAAAPVAFDPGRLRAMRRERGLSQEKLARECGRSTAMIHSLEMGRVQPSLATLAALVCTLGCQLQDLFTDPDPLVPDGRVSA